MTPRARWLASLVDRGYFTRSGVLRYPVHDPDTGEVWTPARDRRAYEDDSRTPSPRCLYCGESYRPKRGEQRYCSRSCAGRARRTA